MSRHWSFYDAETGIFARRRYSASSDKSVSANVPDGHKAIEGRFDHLSQRVDIATGQVIDYQPPAPSPDYEWRENAKNGRPRWVKRADVLEAERRDAAARKRIVELEASQPRAIREHLLDPMDPVPTARLRAIDDEIKTLRADIIARTP